MPSPTVTIDTTDSASLEYGTAAGIPFKRFWRPAYVEGIDVSGSGGNISQALWLAGAAVEAAAASSPLDSSHSDLIISKVFLEPDADRKARARLLYELPIFGIGVPPSTYLLRDTGVGRTFETNRMPGTHAPLDCTYTGVVSGTGSGAGPYTISDRIIYTIMAPLRGIGVSALIYGRPTSAPQDHVTYANDALWPSSAYPGGNTLLAPKGVGYWKLDRYRTDYSVYSGYYTLDAEATTKVTEDWSETGTLRNTQTGRYIKLDPADLAALLAPAYTYSVANGNGIQRVGFYPLLNFVTIFGF